ncbi:MAG: C1 family peptidase [Syntrophobacteraceae bacterium]
MKKCAFIIITAILLTVPSLCGAIDFQPLHPDTAAKIQALKEEVKAKGGTYEVEYSAATDRELSQLTGLKVPAGWNKSDAPSVPMLDATVQTLPSSFSWMSNGVTPIKDQVNCGSCWAFSTVGPLESQILLQGGGTVDLSEQYLLSCNLSGYNCNGGWFAHDYHMDESGRDNNGPGAVLNAADPYTGTDAACRSTYDHPYRLTSWAYIGSESAVPSTDAIKQAIYTYGPVSVAVCAQTRFQNYSGGIFNTSESCGSDPINHAVVLVGWNDNGGTDGYWILRNSWGTSWGLAGYMYIAYGVSQVGYGANFIEYAGGTPPPSPSPSPTPAPVVYEPNLTGVFENLSTGSGGKTLAGIFQVENIGNAATATSFRVLLYLSPNGASKTKSLGSTTITQDIQPGGSVNIKIRKTFTKSVKGQYLIAVVDPDSLVPDSNRSNNVVVSNVLQARARR